MSEAFLIFLTSHLAVATLRFFNFTLNGSDSPFVHIIGFLSGKSTNFRRQELGQNQAEAGNAVLWLTTLSLTAVNPLAVILCSKQKYRLTARYPILRKC